MAMISTKIRMVAPSGGERRPGGVREGCTGVFHYVCNAVFSTVVCG